MWSLKWLKSYNMFIREFGKTDPGVLDNKPVYYDIIVEITYMYSNNIFCVAFVWNLNFVFQGIVKIFIQLRLWFNKYRRPNKM